MYIFRIALFFLAYVSLMTVHAEGSDNKVTCRMLPQVVVVTTDDSISTSKADKTAAVGYVIFNNYVATTAPYSPIQSSIDKKNCIGKFGLKKAVKVPITMRIRGQSTADADKSQYTVDLKNPKPLPSNYPPLKDGWPKDATVPYFLGIGSGKHWVFNNVGFYDKSFVRNAVAFMMQSYLGQVTRSNAWAPHGQYFELFLVTGASDYSLPDPSQLQKYYRGIYLGLEKIRIESSRINIDEYSSDTTNVGGLIVQINSPSATYVCDPTDLRAEGGSYHCLSPDTFANTNNTVMLYEPKAAEFGLEGDLSKQQLQLLQSWYFRVSQDPSGLTSTYGVPINSAWYGWQSLFTNSACGDYPSPTVFCCVDGSCLDTSACAGKSQEQCYWDTVAELTKLESFAEYLLLNEVANDPDGYHRSTFMYRTADTSADGKVIPGKMFAGPLWDKNKAYNNYDEAPYNSYQGWNFLNQCTQAPSWWIRFLASKRYIASVATVWAKGKAQGGPFDFDYLEAYTNKLTSYLVQSGTITRNCSVYNDSDCAKANEQMLSEVEKLQQYLKARIEWIDDSVGTLGKDLPDNTCYTNLVPNS